MSNLMLRGQKLQINRARISGRFFLLFAYFQVVDAEETELRYHA
jgi:hypothetical protein